MPTGNTFADVAAANGLDPALMGRDEATLALIGDFIELHVEQGTRAEHRGITPMPPAADRPWRWAAPSWGTAAGG